ncbi:MAG: hypothetical protein V4539_20125 [Bacteroidota bacterium]
MNICLALLGLWMFASHGNEPLQSVRSKNISDKEVYDTTFLIKRSKDTIYNGVDYHFFYNVYIDTNRNSKNHQLLGDFLFTQDQNIDAYNERIKKRKIALSKIPLDDLPREWVPLYLYKNKYYVYKPSDLGNLGRRIVSDSLLMFWFVDGPMPYVLQSVSKKDNDTWEIRSKDYFVRMEGFIRPEILNIYIIDKENRIAVWEYKSETEKKFNYELYIPKENIKNFDMIVNESDSKMPEFDFDQPDFKKLLRKKTGK